MMTTATPDLYKHHRFPGEIISHAVWLYFRFPLSHRDVEELLFVRGIIVSYEAIRKWCRKFGQQYANQLRRRRPGRVISGIWMKCSSRSTRNGIICGGPWIRMAACSTSLYSDGGISTPPRSFSASSSKAVSMSPGC